MDSKDLERWAARVARRGVRAAVGAAPQAAPPPPAPAPPQRWGGSPRREAPAPLRAAPAGAVWSPRAPESNVLVRPGPSMWDHMLDGVPELVPDLSGGYDSMSDQVSPESAALLREVGVPEGYNDLDRAPRAFGRGLAPAGPVAALKDLPPAPGANQLAIPGTEEK